MYCGNFTQSFESWCLHCLNCRGYAMLNANLTAFVSHSLMGGVTRPCARARQAKRVLTQGRRGVQGRTGASRDKSLKMT